MLIIYQKYYFEFEKKYSLKRFGVKERKKERKKDRKTFWALGSSKDETANCKCQKATRVNTRG